MNPCSQLTRHMQQFLTNLNSGALIFTDLEMSDYGRNCAGELE